MATKTANVLARVEPDVKEQAEAIMAKLGIPPSTVINMLYKQIILTRSIPFSLSLPSTPIVRDEMNATAFDAMMSEGLAQAKAGQGIPLWRMRFVCCIRISRYLGQSAYKTAMIA